MVPGAVRRSEPPYFKNLDSVIQHVCAGTVNGELRPFNHLSRFDSRYSYKKVDIFFKEFIKPPLFSKAYWGFRTRKTRSGCFLQRREALTGGGNKSCTRDIWFISIINSINNTIFIMLYNSLRALFSSAYFIFVCFCCSKMDTLAANAT